MVGAVTAALELDAEETIREEAFDLFQRAVSRKVPYVSFDREKYLTTMRLVFTHDAFFAVIADLSPALTAETGIDRGPEWQKYKIAYFLVDKLRRSLQELEFKSGMSAASVFEDEPEGKP